MADLQKPTKESVRAGINGSDRGTGTSAFAETRGFHCNVYDTYEVTWANGNVVDMILSDGVFYPYAITNILSTSSTAIDAGDITLIY